MIYIIKSGEYIKIGYSKDECTLIKRFKCYNTHNPEYKVLNVFTGEKEDEKKLHQLCLSEKFKTEWFYYSEDIIEKIDKYIKENKLCYKMDTKQYLECVFETELEEIDIEVGEIYNAYRKVLNTGDICDILIMNKNTVYMYVSSPGKKSKLYNVLVNQVKTYYKDYGDDGMNVNATMINNIIVAEFKSYGVPYLEGINPCVWMYDDFTMLPKCVDITKFRNL